MKFHLIKTFFKGMGMIGGGVSGMLYRDYDVRTYKTNYPTRYNSKAREDSKEGLELDARNIGEDFTKVGNDMKKAMRMRRDKG